MSADDCIAILCTSIYPESPVAQEYRVVWCQALENVYISEQDMVSYFKDGKVFDTYREAYQYANRLDEQAGYTEHGILLVRPNNNKTWDELTLKKKYRSYEQ